VTQDVIDTQRTAVFNATTNDGADGSVDVKDAAPTTQEAAGKPPIVPTSSETSTKYK